MTSENPNSTQPYQKINTNNPIPPAPPPPPILSSNPNNSTQLYHKINTNPIPSAPPLPSSSSSNPNRPSSSLSSSCSSSDIPDNIPSESAEDVIISVPGAILHLIDKHHSVELAMGHFSIIQLRQGTSVIAILARVNEIQWPLTRDGACVKLDRTHYFFSVRAPKEHEHDEEMLNYGLTIVSKGQEDALHDLDLLLENYSRFSVQKVEERNGALDVTMAENMSPFDLKSDSKKQVMERSCRAYWTTLAPNVEDYSGTAAKLIAVGSGHLVKGILWCGDVTVERMKWGNEVLKMKIGPGTDRGAVSPQTLKNIRRVNKVTKMTEKVAGGVLSGVLKITGYFSTSVANSKLGKKFFNLVPGEMALATLDGFSKVCDAFEVSGRNVMSTSSTVTTELVTYKYGEDTAKATNEGLHAAGHAVGAAWTVFKIRTAVNPRSVIAPSVLGKNGIRNATDEMKAKAIKDMKAKDSPPKKQRSRRCICM